MFSSLQKEKQAAIQVSEDSSRCKRHRQIEVLEQEKDSFIAVKLSDISIIFSLWMLLNGEITIILVFIDNKSCPRTPTRRWWWWWWWQWQW